MRQNETRPSWPSDRLALSTPASSLESKRMRARCSRKSLALSRLWKMYTDPSQKLSHAGAARISDVVDSPAVDASLRMLGLGFRLLSPLPLAPLCVLVPLPYFLEDPPLSRDSMVPLRPRPTTLSLLPLACELLLRWWCCDTRDETERWDSDDVTAGLIVENVDEKVEPDDVLRAKKPPSVFVAFRICAWSTSSSMQAKEARKSSALHTNCVPAMPCTR
mmetsp:Transcript_5068/g.14341  ORF Transcript_5068/g.14341 Transcript_5068/m.14341 type:complete len:219 (+) Transcript_5068:2202-2858(+)